MNGVCMSMGVQWGLVLSMKTLIYGQIFVHIQHVLGH